MGLNGWHDAGLRLGDEGLFLHDVVTDIQKVILAASLAPFERNETIEQLTGRLPYDHMQIKQARAAMEANGTLTLSPITPLKKGAQLTDTNRRGRTVLAVDPRFEHRHGLYTWLPAESVEAICSVAARAATTPLLLAMLYRRTQLITGAAFAYEAALRADLQVSSKVLKRAIGVLKAADLLTQHDTFSGTPIYTMSCFYLPPANISGVNFARVLRETTRDGRPKPAPSATEPIPA